MHRQSTSWFQGWKILIRCAEFTCRDGTPMFASTALLKHMPPPSDRTSLHWPDKIARSIVFPETAFCSAEDAVADAISKARRQILAMNGNRDCNGGKLTESAGDSGSGQESDESLAARFEISFDGWRYAFRQHRYDVFQDALRYAVAEHTKSGFLPDDTFQPSWQAAYHPTGEDENMMTLHGIVWVEGHFLYGGHRYGQLCDAVAFAAGHPNL
jgi:hypothetical protein